MSNFHRWQVPTYTGAPAIPNPGPTPVSFNGVDYSYVNVTPGGDGGGDGSAFADSSKGAGPNVGTFWVAFGEDATTVDVNRGFRALAENTDTLDDRFHSDLAVSILPPYVTAIGATPTIILLGPGVFVGNILGYPLEMLFEVVDDLNREIFDPASGEKINVASITGAAIGDGFSVGNITLNLNFPIQNGQTYSVWYGFRSNLASLPVDALNFHRIRAANEVDAEVENVFRSIQGTGAVTSIAAPSDGVPLPTPIVNVSSTENYPSAGSFFIDTINTEVFYTGLTPTSFVGCTGGVGTMHTGYTVQQLIPWNQVPPTTTLYMAAASGLNERYNRNTIVALPLSPPEAYWPTLNLDTPGGGGWFDRSGPAVTGYSEDGGAYVDPLQAIFAAKVFDTAVFQGANPGAGGAVGFSMFGARRTGSPTIAWAGESLHTPGFAGFLQLWPHDFQASIHATNPFTRIVDGATADLTAHAGVWDPNTGEATIAVTGASYFRNGASLSTVAPGYDLLEVTYIIAGTTFTKTFVIVAFGETGDTANPQKVRVRNLDGTVPDFRLATTGTVRWVSTTFAVGDGAGAYHNATFTDVAPVLLDGLFYQVPAELSTNAGDDNVTRTPPSFSAYRVSPTASALQWGGFQHFTPYGPTFQGTLNGDGGITTGATSLSTFNGQVNLEAIVLFDAASTAVFENIVHFNGTSNTTFLAGAELTVQNGVLFEIMSGVLFANGGGPSPNFFIGEVGAPSIMTLFGDAATIGGASSVFHALGGSITRVSGRFLFDGDGADDGNGVVNSANFLGPSFFTALATFNAATFNGPVVVNSGVDFMAVATFHAFAFFTALATFTAAGPLIPAITVSQGTVAFTGPQPVSTDVLPANNLSAKNFSKAWGLATTLASTGDQTLSPNGINIKSISVTSWSPLVIAVTFETNMADGAYFSELILNDPLGANQFFTQTYNRFADHFTCEIYLLNGSGNVVPALLSPDAGLDITCNVFARQ